MSIDLNKASIGELRSVFGSLSAPDAALRDGFYRAQFIGPWWLRASGRPSVALSGLPGWLGKRFLTPDVATNILQQGADTVQALSMTVVPGISQVDGKPGLALHYGKNAAIPWRWVRDELRVLDDKTLLCFTVINLPVLRHLAFPFLLERQP